MTGIEEFIKEYGDISFEEKPFCDADNVALCSAFYMPLDKVVSPDFDTEPVDFAKVSEDMFEYMGSKHKAQGIMITKNCSITLVDLAHCPRYEGTKVVACQEVFQTDPAIQFGAATFILPNGDVVVPFRGTDDTIAGWKEDFDLFLKRGIPSHQIAVDYLEKAAAKFDGDIIVCGHSKGGNVALYAALNCSKAVRDRLKLVYNNDGPGFIDYSFLSTEAYKELLPKYRHFVPDSSMVGMLLAHDDDYTVIKSSRHIGALQHDLATWRISDGEMETAEELTKQGRFYDLALSRFIYRISDEQTEVLDKVFTDLISATGEISLTGFVKNLIPAIDGAVKKWKDIDEDTKEAFKNAFKGTGMLIVGTAKAVKEEALSVTSEKAKLVATKVLANA